MKTNFCVTAFCVTSGLFVSQPVAAFDWDLYGKLELQALHVDNGLYRYADQGWQIEAPSSRVGFKAKQKLTEDVDLVMVYEWQVNGLDKANKDHKLGSRNTYLGLASSWGELFFGKNDTRFKKSEGKIDLFNESLNDIAQLTPGQDRLENIVGYSSPVINGWQWSATYQTGASDEIAGGYDWTLSYGDASFKTHAYYLAYGQARELNNIDADRILLHMKLAEMQQGTLSGGLMYQKSEHITKPLKGDTFMAELAFARDKLTYKVQWQRDDSKIRAKETGTLVSLGLDYALEKDLVIYGMLSDLDFVTTDDNSAALGFRYTF